MYVKYVQSFRRLEECYDQIAHAQKRRILRNLLDGVMGRLIELKHEMIRLEFSEYHFFDDVLQDLKLTPNDIELPVPKYFIIEKVEAIQEKEKLLQEILAHMSPQESKVWILLFFVKLNLQVAIFLSLFISLGQTGWRDELRGGYSDRAES